MKIRLVLHSLANWPDKHIIIVNKHDKVAMIIDQDTVYRGALFLFVVIIGQSVITEGGRVQLQLTLYTQGRLASVL